MAKCHIHDEEINIPPEAAVATMRSARSPRATTEVNSMAGSRDFISWIPDGPPPPPLDIVPEKRQQQQHI